MNYICLVYHEEKALMDLSMEEHEDIVANCIKWIDDVTGSGHHVYSAGLQSIRSAATLQHINGELKITDGPFAETKEVLGGFTIIEARDLNEAISIASKLPANRIGKIEVRPILDPSVEMDDPLDQRVVAAIRRGHKALP